MLALLLIIIPLLAGCASFLLKSEQIAKISSLVAGIVTLGIAVIAVFTLPSGGIAFIVPWMTSAGASFSLHIDSVAAILVLLTALSFTLIFISTWHNRYAHPATYYGLMLLTQAGLMGVFLASDGLLFYFCWELALVPVYFLCSGWGGERRISVTFKFFIYTFAGSLLMLAGLIYLYILNPEQSFSIASFYRMSLEPGQQQVLFWLFFIAFAIKMPIFPFHTWQPDTYEQAPTSVTMVLSAVMVKMGIYGVIRWIIPIFPDAVIHFGHLVVALSTIGMIYASLIAWRQDDLKRLAAYLSIAHMGLMCAAVFSQNLIGMEGTIAQLFNHGINILGLWIIIDAIEKQLNIRKISELGGLAQKAPFLAAGLAIVTFANIAIPLTNAFVSEFLMFFGLYQFNVWYMAFAGLSIILSAMYMLRMLQYVIYGNLTPQTEKIKDLSTNQQVAIGVIVFLIIGLGVYPQPLLYLTQETLQFVSNINLQK